MWYTSKKHEERRNLYIYKIKESASYTYNLNGIPIKNNSDMINVTSETIIIILYNNEMNLQD